MYECVRLSISGRGKRTKMTTTTTTRRRSVSPRRIYLPQCSLACHRFVRVRGIFASHLFISRNDTLTHTRSLKSVCRCRRRQRQRRRSQLFALRIMPHGYASPAAAQPNMYKLCKLTVVRISYFCCALWTLGWGWDTMGRDFKCEYFIILGGVLAERIEICEEKWRWIRTQTHRCHLNMICRIWRGILAILAMGGLSAKNLLHYISLNVGWIRLSRAPIYEILVCVTFILFIFLSGCVLVFFLSPGGCRYLCCFVCVLFHRWAEYLNMLNKAEQL